MSADFDSSKGLSHSQEVKRHIELSKLLVGVPFGTPGGTNRGLLDCVPGISCCSRDRKSDRKELLAGIPARLSQAHPVVQGEFSNLICFWPS